MLKIMKKKETVLMKHCKEQKNNIVEKKNVVVIWLIYHQQIPGILSQCGSLLRGIKEKLSFSVEDNHETINKEKTVKLSEKKNGIILGPIEKNPI